MMSVFGSAMSFIEPKNLSLKSERTKRIKRIEKYYRDFLITAHPEAKPSKIGTRNLSVASDSILLEVDEQV
jgi:hypothetical protein